MDAKNFRCHFLSSRLLVSSVETVGQNSEVPVSIDETASLAFGKGSKKYEVPVSVVEVVFAVVETDHLVCGNGC